MNDFETRARKAADAVRRQVASLPASPDEGIRRAQRSLGRTVLVGAVAAVVLVGVVAVGLPRLSGVFNSASSGSASSAGDSGGAATLTGLETFDSCDNVLRYFKDHAPDYLIDRVVGRVSASSDTSTRQAGGAVSAANPSAGAASAGGAEEYSTTNIQEAGVDEPDIVKTDGNRIVALAQGRVHLISSVRGELTLHATLPGAQARNVFLRGARLVVFGGNDGPGAEPGSPWAGSESVVTVYDLTKINSPRRIATLTVDGNVIDARLVGTQVRLATVAAPDLDIASPTFTPEGRPSARSERALREAVARTTVDDWIPSYVLRGAAGERVASGRFVDCANLARPARFSGIDTVAVTSFDIDAALQDRRSVGLIAGGEQIYASGNATYVSSTEWGQDGPPATTSVHRFVTNRSGETTYTGSREVPGTLLNQYAMSEYDGVLRVATTVSERRGWVNTREVTEGMVTILQAKGGSLRQLGQVRGLGRQDNESIRAVRFIEDRGYVITFRQTDPLYVLDLRDAAAPHLLGELKIPGYSGYLHPVGKDLLFGVGQSGVGASSSGQPAVEFSLFDISNPASPRRIDTQRYGAGTAAAEFDPKAFLYWPTRDLVIAPTSLYGDENGHGSFSGVLLLRATEDGLTELGKIAVPPSDGMAQRSVVIGDQVFLLSDQALQSVDLDTLRPIDALKL